MRREEILSTLSGHHKELKQFGVKHIGIFGSAARDELEPHEQLDVFVEFDPESQIGLFGFVRLQTRLGEILGREVTLSEPEGLREWKRGHYLRDAIYAD